MWRVLLHLKHVFHKAPACSNSERESDTVSTSGSMYAVFILTWRKFVRSQSWTFSNSFQRDLEMGPHTLQP